MIKKITTWLSILIALSMLLAACAQPQQATQAPSATQAPAQPQPAAQEPIKIGILSAFTGVFSAFGEMQRTGYEMALEEWGGKVAGRDIKIIEEDDQLNNELAVTKAKKLVEQDKIDILTGLVSGDEGLAVGAYMKDKNIPVLPMYSASEDMTMRQWFPLMVRDTWTGAQSMDVFGYWLAKDKGWKKVYMIGEDYSYPYNQGGGFKRGFCRGGGELVTTIWHPVPLDDYSSIIAQIPLDQGYDAVMYNGSGSDAVAFTKQWVDLGMVGKIPLIGQSNTFEQGDLPAMPIEAVKGGLNAHHYAESLTSAEAIAFAKKYEEKNGRPPAAAAEFAYDVMRLILRAIEKTNGDVSDPAALVAAMKQVDQSDAPRGPLTLGEFNDVIENVYIREVQVGDDGKAFNKVLFYVPNVTQFGPYDKTLYMAQPPDSNTYPPEKCTDYPKEMLDAQNIYEFKEYK
jgi:branched-chain amino acid transport system substrate-binding protein